MASDDVWMVTCDGRRMQRALTKAKAYRLAELMQDQADYSHGTKIRASAFNVERDAGVLKEEDALFKSGKRRTLVVRP